jgi:hypothetical protein
VPALLRPAGGFNEWPAVLGDAKITTVLPDRHTHRGHILDTENDRDGFKPR